MSNLAKNVKKNITSPDKSSFSCPNYAKFWISDISCSSKGLTNISKCEINSKFNDDHDCDNTDCIWVGCDGNLKKYIFFLFKKIIFNNISIIKIFY